MRRLKSTYTLLSDENSQQDSTTCNDDIEQFTWSQLFASEPAVSADSYRHSNPGLLESFVQHQQRNGQDAGEHHQQHNLLKSQTTIWSEQDDIMLSTPPPVEILSDEEGDSSYGPFGDSHVHPDICQTCPLVTSYGSITLLLRHLVRVDLSPNGAIYVHNAFDDSIAAINGAGDKSCIIHANSRVFQDGHEVHVATYQNRIAKICQRGIVFSSSSRSLAYLVDESGTKTTADRFLDLRGDFSLDVFYDHQEGHAYDQCYDLVAKSVHKSFQNGDDMWVIGGTLVKQDRYGNIEVSRQFKQWIVTILPTIGEVSVTTPYLSATAGCYSKRYLTLHMDNRKITSGYCGLTIQNGSQKAGLDRNGKVVIF